jgi:hypothetical protein
VATGLAEWFGRARSADAEDDFGGCIRVGSPGGVDRERAGACARAEPVADELAFEEERGAGAALGWGPVA